MAAISKDREKALLRQLEHLYRFTGLVGSTLRVDMLVDDTMHPMLEIARAERVAVILAPVGESGGSAVKTMSWNELSSLTLALEDVASLGTDVMVFGAEDELPVPIKPLFAGTAGKLVVVPLFAYGRPLGIVAFTARDDVFDSITQRLLLNMGRQLSLSVENARLFAELEMSYHQLLYAQDDTIRAERTAAIGAIAATLAHEIRNPLATIFSSLSQIRKHARIEGDSATLLEIAEEEAIRMNRMVSGLLDFARPGAPRFEQAAITKIVEEMVQRIKESMDPSVAIEISVETEREDILASVDIAMFKKALSYVLDNAISAVDSKTGRIDVRIGTEVEKHQKRSVVVITVTDNGNGVSREVQNKVFEPFFSTKPSGIGLGLPTVARIVNDHGGTVSFDSDKDFGTVVRMTFCVEQIQSVESQATDEIGL